MGAAAGLVIGCDIGTQSLKGVLVDVDGRTRAIAAEQYEPEYPRSAWAEQDPAVWIAAASRTVGRLLRNAAVAPVDVKAIAFASQVDGLVALDEAGRPLHPAILWLDRRAVDEADELRRTLSAETIRSVTGLNADATHVAPKLLWLRAHHPELEAAATTIHVPGSFMVEHLTGQRAVDGSNASSTMLMDVIRRDWSDQFLASVGIDRTRLPSIAAASEVAGPLTPDAAAELGLTTDCLVAVGCGDEHAACLAAGVTAPGPICDITGTAEPVAVAAREPVFDPLGLLETHAHADARGWLIENPGFVSGGSVRWCADNVLRGSYAAFVEAAASAPAGSDGIAFLPSLSGAMVPRWNSRARGVFAGLSMSHTTAHLARAVFEGCTFGLRDVVERFSQLGLGGDEVRVVGGGARSPFWLQMKADVTRLVVRRTETDEASAVGAAMLAGTAARLFSNLDEATDLLCRLDSRLYVPNEQTFGAYDDAYAFYRAMFDVTEPVFDARGLATRAPGGPRD